jgi:pilus assembly protein FimV
MDMCRKLAVAAALLCLSATSNVLAIGLGKIEIESRLNDPLNAVIQLTSASPKELRELKVAVAPRESFDRLGLPRPTILDDVKFTIEQPPGGKPSIRVTTRQPVREPFLDFLIEASWSKGRLLRQYTLLVDPPVTMPVAPPARQLPVRQASSTPPETKHASPPRARVPAVVPATAAPAPVAPRVADKYGPVKRSETLWEIAKRIRPDSDIGINQMMLALLRANPQAFTDNNINNLKAGSTLRIPQRDEILSLDRAAARHEARRQYTAWQQARSTETPAEQASTAETAPAAKPSEAARASAPEAAPPVTDEAHLQLTAPDDETLEGSGVPGAPAGNVTAQAPKASELLQQLTVATEEAEAGRAQTQALQSRVDKLKDQVAGMQRLIELKDQQLANLQNRLARQDPSQAADAQPHTAATPGDRTKAPGKEAGAATAAHDAGTGGIVDRLLDNPVLTGLGVLVAMILGGFLWASTRHRRHEDIFGDEPTLASQLPGARREEVPVEPHVTVSDTAPLGDLAASEMSPLEGDEASDPLTEADVFIAYGRLQQAEEVISHALQANPASRELKMKLIEIYHAAGNTVAFDAQAALFRELVGEDDPDWERVVSMGSELSPDNPLYQESTASRPLREGEMDLSGVEVSSASGNAAGDDSGPVPEGGAKETRDRAESIDFDLAELNIAQREEDVAGGDDSGPELEGGAKETRDRAENIDFDLTELNIAQREEDISAGDDGGPELEGGEMETGDRAESIDFDLAELNGDQGEEDIAEGMLPDSDEIGTKLDLARAYMDMGDGDGARGILEEVIEEGNDDQKDEAENLIAQLA